MQLYFSFYLTQADESHRSIYEFFEVENNVPTFAYDYDTAVYKDHVLVPFCNVEENYNPSS